MPAQTGEILPFQKCGIADLHGIAELRRQGREERIELVEKRGGVREGTARESAELEYQESRFIAVVDERPQKHVSQHGHVEETRVFLAGFRAIPKVRGECLAGDQFG